MSPTQHEAIGDVAEVTLTANHMTGSSIPFDGGLRATPGNSLGGE